jgi:hypothetical protein
MKQARIADLPEHFVVGEPISPMAVMPMAVMPPVPAMMMMVVAPPAHLSRRLLCVRLNRRGRAGIAQRQRLRLLGRRCDRKQCGDRRETQNLRRVHKKPSLE